MDCETNATSKPLALIKRKRLSPAEREQILERFHQGVLTIKDFSAQEGISKSTLSNWLHEQRESGTAEVPTISFQELKLPQAVGSWAVEIVTPNCWTVRLAQSPETGTLRKLLEALPC